MAELHVQTKKHQSSSPWLWIVLALVVLGALGFYLMNRNKAEDSSTHPATTSGVYSPARNVADVVLEQPNSAVVN